uniref:Growth factor receptor domain-containing protein n=1 Tax=Parascaris equorum TaxID=6256 RepID=A0A914S7R9_PAREQ
MIAVNMGGRSMLLNKFWLTIISVFLHSLQIFKARNSSTPNFRASHYGGREQINNSEPHPDTISFGDLRSAPDCHPECIGCSESRSAVSCFACKHLTQNDDAYCRCVSRCDEGFFVEGDKCRSCSPNCKSCIKAEQCQTCPGAKLLIDVDHYAHLDHGQCVDTCPENLEADYTIAIQARCVLKKNICSVGYYEAPNLMCTICDDACSSCHGPGPLQCDSCAPNYSNLSVGYLDYLKGQCHNARQKEH